MVSIANLRQIVVDMHQVFPQGVRKVVRQQLLEDVNACYCSIGWNAKKQLTQHNCVKPFYISHLNNKNYKYNELESYFSNIFDKELNIVGNSLLKKMGTVIKSSTRHYVNPLLKFSIVSGLVNSENAGLKLPKEVILKKMKKYDGFFQPTSPDKIYINPFGIAVSETTIHETAHLNDIKGSYERFLWFLTKIGRQKHSQFKQHKKLIESEILKYAGKNMDEFIACTAQKLIARRLSWSDFNPKIKQLYELYKGPSINRKGLKPFKNPIGELLCKLQESNEMRTYNLN